MRNHCPEITVVSFLKNAFSSFFTTSNYQLSLFFIRVLVSASCPVYYSQSIGYASGFFGVFYTCLIMGSQTSIKIYTGQLM